MYTCIYTYIFIYLYTYILIYLFVHNQPARRARRPCETAESAMTGSIFEAENGETFGALGKGENHGAVASLKRTFREAVLSPVLGHGFSYVGVFAFELHFRTTLGAKRNLTWAKSPLFLSCWRGGGVIQCSLMAQRIYCARGHGRAKELIIQMLSEQLRLWGPVSNITPLCLPVDSKTRTNHGRLGWRGARRWGRAGQGRTGRQWVGPPRKQPPFWLSEASKTTVLDDFSKVRTKETPCKPIRGIRRAVDEQFTSRTAAALRLGCWPTGRRFFINPFHARHIREKLILPNVPVGNRFEDPPEVAPPYTLLFVYESSKYKKPHHLHRRST